MSSEGNNLLHEVIDASCACQFAIKECMDKQTTLLQERMEKKLSKVACNFYFLLYEPGVR